MSNRIKCCIIGIPDHQGVIHVGGRIGAARGPHEFRHFFKKMNGRIPFSDQVVDQGDVQGFKIDIEHNHKQVCDFISKNTESGMIPIVIGGGHDHGYSHLWGLSQGLKTRFPKLKLGCINIDAHLDVRKPSPIITSGSPFYLAIESGILDPKRFVEFGIQSHCNGPQLWNFIEEKKIKVVPFAELRNGAAVSSFKKNLKKLSSHCDFVAISLDLDALASAYAPGVSAPQSEGFTAMDIIEMMEIAGRDKQVISLGIFELNPEHDVDHRTSRLAATSAYHFIESVLSRKSLF
jgi:formiminoglutamase